MNPYNSTLLMTGSHFNDTSSKEYLFSFTLIVFSTICLLISSAGYYLLMLSLDLKIKNFKIVEEKHK